MSSQHNASDVPRRKVQGEPLAVKSTNPWLAFGCLAAVFFLAGSGFVLSFSALRDLAVRCGLDENLAFLWPLIVDGFIVVATLAAFVLRSRKKQAWYPWAALAVFASISVAGNAAHALSSHRLGVPEWIAAVVSAVPAIALLGASHLVVLMIDGKIARPVARRSTPVRNTANEPATPTAPSKPSESAQRSDDPSADRRVSESAEDRPSSALRALPTEDERLLEKVRARVAEGEKLTGALVGEIEGVSSRTGRRRLDRLRERFPELDEWAATGEVVNS